MKNMNPNLMPATLFREVGTTIKTGEAVQHNSILHLDED